MYLSGLARTYNMEFIKSSLILPATCTSSIHCTLCPRLFESTPKEERTHRFQLKAYQLILVPCLLQQGGCENQLGHLHAGADIGSSDSKYTQGTQRGDGGSCLPGVEDEDLGCNAKESMEGQAWVAM